MLQILGESFLIATRMDRRFQDRPCGQGWAPRLPEKAAGEKRRGWLRLAGLLF